MSEMRGPIQISSPRLSLAPGETEAQRQGLADARGGVLAWPGRQVSGCWIPILLSEYLKRDAHLESEGAGLGADGTHQDYIKPEG